MGVWQTIARRLIRFRYIDFLKDILPFMLTAAAACAIAYFITLSITNLWLLLPLRIIIVAALYLGVIKLAHAQILEECIAFVRRKK